jgi:hypothetical protein
MSISRTHRIYPRSTDKNRPARFESVQLNIVCRKERYQKIQMSRSRSLELEITRWGMGKRMRRVLCYKQYLGSSWGRVVCRWVGCFTVLGENKWWLGSSSIFKYCRSQTSWQYRLFSILQKFPQSFTQVEPLKLKNRSISPACTVSVNPWRWSTPVQSQSRPRPRSRPSSLTDAYYFCTTSVVNL